MTMKGNPGARSCNDVVRRLVGDPQKRRRAMPLAFAAFGFIYFFIDKNKKQLRLLLPEDSNSYLRSSSIGGTAYGTSNRSTANEQQQPVCDFYLAESAIPHGGLGVFTTKPLAEGAPAQPWPDICVYLTDASMKQGTEIDTHTWQSYRFGAQWLGGRRSVRAACMGLVTIFNSMGLKKYASARPDVDSKLIHTNGGLDRSKDPGAGAITQYYGATSVAIRDLVAGSELMLWDNGHGGDQYKLDGIKNDGRSELDIDVVPPPIRPPEWLQKHGMCADNLIVQTATDPSMGRGAFAKRFMSKGTVVAPAPLQIYPNRDKFSSSSKKEESEKDKKMKYETEQLFVNYSFQPKGSTLLLYPYGPGVGLINHASSKKSPGKINAILQWSEHHMNHGTRWLDSSFTLDQFWKMQYPGSLILDVVALRDIRQGEEIFMDYGTEWETAWNEHVRKWKPDVTTTTKNKNYVYPWDEMNNHDTVTVYNKNKRNQQHDSMIKPFRTLSEQEANPYPDNLLMVCDTNNWSEERDERMQWRPSLHWPEQLAECDVLSRKTYDGATKAESTYLYEVVLWPDEPDIAPEDGKPVRYIDYNVPHDAIRFVDKPFQSDQHIATAFRHPIGFPDDLTPPFWRNALS